MEQNPGFQMRPGTMPAFPVGGRDVSGPLHAPQAPARVVVKEDSLLPELLPENPILRYEVLDSILLSAIDPAREDQEQELPRLKLRFHLPPDARLRSAASEIDGSLSSVEHGSTRVRTKSHCYNCLRLG